MPIMMVYKFPDHTEECLIYVGRHSPPVGYLDKHFKFAHGKIEDLGKEGELRKYSVEVG